MSITSPARRAPIFALEPLEDRRLLSAQPILNGLAINGETDAAEGTRVMVDLGVKAVRIFGTTGSNAAGSSYAGFTDPARDFGTNLSSASLSRIKYYHDHNFNVTLLVTPPEASDYGNTDDSAPLNAPSASQVTTYFQSLMSDYSSGDRNLKSWVDRWEIVNEPNLDKYYNSSRNSDGTTDVKNDLTNYVLNVLKPAYQVLHANGETVVGGGIAWSQSTASLQALFDAGYAQYADILNFHPYGGIGQEVIDHIHDFKGVFDATGKPFTLTEWNVHSSNSDIISQNNIAYNYIKTVAESQFYFRLGYTHQDDYHERGLVHYRVSDDKDGAKLSTYTPVDGNYQMYLAWAASTSSPPPAGTRDPYTTIEAEAADEFSGNSATGTSPPHVGYFSGGDFIRFDAVDFGSGAASVELRTASPYDNGYFQLRLDSATGPVVGTVHPAATTGYADYQSTIAPVTGATGTHALYLVAVSTNGGGMPDVDWLKFTPASAPLTLSASDDGFVRDGQYANTTYNTDTLEIKTILDGYNRQSYLKFSVGAVSPSFSHATLRLWGSIRPQSPSTVSSVVARLSRVTDGWSQGNLTFNNKPSTFYSGSSPSATIAGSTGAWYDFDVTDYLRGERASGDSVFSVVAIADQADTITQFDSSESTGGHAPQLVVTA